MGEADALLPVRYRALALEGLKRPGCPWAGLPDRILVVDNCMKKASSVDTFTPGMSILVALWRSATFLDLRGKRALQTTLSRVGVLRMHTGVRVTTF